MSRKPAAAAPEMARDDADQPQAGPQADRPRRRAGRRDPSRAGELTAVGNVFGPGVDADPQGAWLSLRTLILLRWMAVAGQGVALIAAVWLFDLDPPLGMGLAVIMVSVAANFALAMMQQGSVRLTGAPAVLMLLFDLVQLALLLGTTGGLTNPFALLMLVPVTIAASALALRHTLAMGAASILLVSLLWQFYLPLRFHDGRVIELPALFRFGFWLALVIGILFLGLYVRRVATEVRSMSTALLATQMALAREQKLTDLGGVVAAAAHELGTPLATIKLVSAEMMDALEDQPDIHDDARLIREQADRCTAILRSMGRAGKDDLHMRAAPFGAVLREAAEPHMQRGKTVHIDLRPASGGAAREPSILRRPEVIHGLRNLIQNAVDFAADNVWIEGTWTADRIRLRLTDDGPGYPPQLIGRIGDPFVRSRRSAARPEYEGMGLGLFIAKTLLERTGARLVFSNAVEGRPHPERCGAVVEAIWPLGALRAPADLAKGENQPIEG